MLYNDHIEANDNDKELGAILKEMAEIRLELEEVEEHLFELKSHQILIDKNGFSSVPLEIHDNCVHKKT